MNQGARFAFPDLVMSALRPIELIEDTPKEIVSDWLEERGRDAEAEIVRTLVRMTA